MKRYRVTSFDFDARANILKFGEKSKNSTSVKGQLVQEFGAQNFSQKLSNFQDLGCYFPSILAFHNIFMRQVRTSFVAGGYYPALTGACSLGERILNHLILSLRNEFKSSPQYKKVYSKKSFDDWDLAIGILEKWKVLLPGVVDDFKALKKMRHEFAVHFNPITDTDDRALALEAITLLSNIIKTQFGAFGSQPWFIEGTAGAFYIKLAFESDPFVKTIYLPNCTLVGPKHQVKINRLGKFIIKDDFYYEEKEVSDTEFVRLLS